MFLKTKIQEIFKSLATRYFNTTTMSGRASKSVQYHSGGDDYCPLEECEGLSECIGDNPADGVVFAWRDGVVRQSAPGEKRIYAIKIDSETGEPVRNSLGAWDVAAEIHLQNDGCIDIIGGKDLKIYIQGNACLSCAGNLELEAQNITSLGTWTHDGSFSATTIEAGNGTTGTFTQSVTISKGITTEGT